jgi:Holliday junction DNA helicase RuvA
MIYRLKGTVIDFDEDFLVLDVNNVGYQVFASSRDLSKIAVDQAADMHIYTHVREDQITLFGFLSSDDRKMYMKLTSVNGVGPKAGMAILSVCSADDVVEAVNTGNSKILQAAKGIGKKVAERIVLDLSGKLPTLSAGLPKVGAQGGEKSVMNTVAINDVISALTNMGFKNAQANQAVSQAVRETAVNDDFGLLLKEALRILKS